jgi:hypothetical protein
MFAQVSTQIVDSTGFGVAEWIGLITVGCLFVGTVVGAIVQLVKLRHENTEQHAEGRAIVTDVRDRLLDLHTSVGRVDQKVERLDERLDQHEQFHHRNR